MNKETYCLLENFMLSCMEDAAHDKSISQPLYSLLPDGSVSTGKNDVAPSFFQEYKYKLENLYSNFYIEKAAAIARERRYTAAEFYDSLYQEINLSYQNGTAELRRLSED